MEAGGAVGAECSVESVEVAVVVDLVEAVGSQVQ